MPADTGTWRVLGHKRGLEFCCWNLGEARGDFAQWFEEHREGFCFSQNTCAVIEAPAERNNPAISFEAMKIEGLDVELSKLSDERLFLPFGE